MGIKRRTPEVTADIARRLKQIDIDGQPRGAEAQAEAAHFVHYGWVTADEWSLTDAGLAAMNGYYNQIAAERKEREARTYTQPTARELP